MRPRLRIKICDVFLLTIPINYQHFCIAVCSGVVTPESFCLLFVVAFALGLGLVLENQEGNRNFG